MGEMNESVDVCEDRGEIVGKNLVGSFWVKKDWIEGLGIFPVP